MEKTAVSNQETCVGSHSQPNVLDYLFYLQQGKRQVKKTHAENSQKKVANF